MRFDPRRRQGRREPDTDRPERQDASALIVRGGHVVGGLAYGGLKEIGAFWLATAEALGRAELRVLRALRGPATTALAAVRRGYAWARVEVTPERAVAAVVVAVAVLLAISQFVDYRGVRVGAPQYQGVEAVAPAPQVDRETAGHAHLYLLVPAALVAIVTALWALGGRWRLGRVVSLIGVAGVAISLLIDAPKGLQEGSAGIAFEGARAVLIGGFWVQLTSSAVLVIAGVLLARYVRAAAGAADRDRRHGRLASRGDRAPVAGVRA